MLVQVMERRVGNLEGLQAQLAAWMSDLQPGADGRLGTTAGVTADGTFIAVTRFDSQDAAKAITSEGEARANEDAAPTSDEDRADAERLTSLMPVDRYIDLPDPMLYSR